MFLSVHVGVALPEVRHPSAAAGGVEPDTAPAAALPRSA